MKVKLKNLGILSKAEFEVGDLTIICGDNNSGKTYATYALFGFLYSWKYLIEIDVEKAIINDLVNQGFTSINLSKYIEKLELMLNKCYQDYCQDLDHIFATSLNKFQDTKFTIESLPPHDTYNIEHESSTDIGREGDKLFFVKKQSSSILQVIFVSNSSSKEISILGAKAVAGNYMTNVIIKLLFPNTFPKPFILSAERTGASVFHSELNFARSRLLEELSQKVSKDEPTDLLLKEAYGDYDLATRNNVDFTNRLASISKQISQVAHQQRTIISAFTDIIGGEYLVSTNDELYFVPNHNKEVKLTMNESSSSVRSLLNLAFYLKHIAKKGDLLIIDEPELNLHPGKQRRFARLIAKLVNFGIKVLLTTHSDYLIKELNTLIMLNNDKPHLESIAEQESYKKDELLDIEKIKVYVTQRQASQQEDQKEIKTGNTLIAANINQELGIELTSFDTEIDKMNQIQEAILWGK